MSQPPDLLMPEACNSGPSASNVHTSVSQTAESEPAPTQPGARDGSSDVVRRRPCRARGSPKARLAEWRRGSPICICKSRVTGRPWRLRCPWQTLERRRSECRQRDRATRGGRKNKAIVSAAAAGRSRLGESDRAPQRRSGSIRTSASSPIRSPETGGRRGESDRLGFRATQGPCLAHKMLVTEKVPVATARLLLVEPLVWPAPESPRDMAGERRHSERGEREIAGVEVDAVARGHRRRKPVS